MLKLKGFEERILAMVYQKLNTVAVALAIPSARATATVLSKLCSIRSNKLNLILHLASGILFLYLALHKTILP
ncbi:MAG TPA: hypothetical protein VNB90_06680 [Cytophagaceae bacterium]|jgi:hypothetical protein|nr:hypothetical protein [Cytophagaceae bacterium]